jgi:hypothetical protein
MNRHFALDSNVTIPVAHDHDIVSAALTQEGALEIAYGIDYCSTMRRMPAGSSFPSSSPGEFFPMSLTKSSLHPMLASSN